MKKTIFFIALFVLGLTLNIHAQYKTKNVILITIDGLRWQEVFAGADSNLLYNKTYLKKTQDFEKKYWDVNPLVRRKLLMPFVWETMAVKGQIYGNRKLGSNVDVANPYWFSYPGYSEIACGFADDSINSNEKGPNPNITMFEKLNKVKGFENKIAVFASWETFNDIYNEKRSGFLVNAAYEPLTGKEFGPKTELLNKIQNQLPDVFFGIRLDAPTFHQSFEYMKVKKPRVLHIALDETDDFAHHGSYDYYLNAARYTDDFIKELWEYVQNTPEYKDKTSIFIACDHGRGIDPEGWKSHGTKTAHSSETWFAVMGPDTPAKGEMKGGQYYNMQFAKTLATLLGFDYTNSRPVGDAILPVMGK